MKKYTAFVLAILLLLFAFIRIVPNEVFATNQAENEGFAAAEEARNPYQKELFEPIAKEQTVEVGYEVLAEDSIANLGELPIGTRCFFLDDMKYEVDTFNQEALYEDPEEMFGNYVLDTSVAEQKLAFVIVVYPDGSIDLVRVLISIEAVAEATEDDVFPLDELKDEEAEDIPVEELEDILFIDGEEVIADEGEIDALLLEMLDALMPSDEELMLPEEEDSPPEEATSTNEDAGDLIETEEGLDMEETLPAEIPDKASSGKAGQDALADLESSNPDRKLDFYVDWGSKRAPQLGDIVTLRARLSGYEGLEYTVRWQVKKSHDADWQDLNAEGESYTLVLSEENLDWLFRLAVDITDVEIEEK